MVKKVILGLTALVLVGAGVAAFSANTAQWVNVHARVEKEIEVACVLADGTIDPDGCEFGVVFPENVHEKLVEVTLSNSFFNQDEKSSVLYWVMWECKQYDPERDLNEDGIGDCRVDAPTPHSIVYDEGEKKYVHGDQELDGGIRDYIDISTTASCLRTPSDYEGSTAKHIEAIGNGSVSLAAPKCFYDLIFTPPACAGHWNPITDPLADPTEIDCHEITTSDDPQDWDRFAEVGDEFKIQVYDFGID